MQLDPVAIPIRDAQFRTVFALRAARTEHIVYMEADGLLLLLAWLVRDPRNHGNRAVVLGDNVAVIFSVEKGRSSSKRLNRTIRRIAALCTAADVQLHLLYVPSAHNPSDAGSRHWLMVPQRRGASAAGRATRSWEEFTKVYDGAALAWQWPVLMA